ncbi:hypothetical protein TraAM80_07341 [Trypanosoma rangeli]|uniref:Uncharacterized protein n=1 Tax=Trypanosoma rangeli TaxID=5698 RepID=A0A3R7K387_TRYRA|nr:uncharacterized protein TraAM80_07341 [Trypanosoma rangeli]RNF00941.1 hypothetical protein TraAM80_07341 [Trypanosoma rangeli]|eukprot:RNF00941.1 hypothetical protein TraAM80_07341 [Trypanosoma rangeli]
MMVRPAFAEVLVASVRDALAKLQDVKSEEGDAVQNTKKRPRATRDVAISASSSTAIVPLRYPVGRSTLQVTGVHVSMQETEQAEAHTGNVGDFVVLLRAHVKGRLDHAARVFTVAAMKFAADPSMGRTTMAEGGAREDARHAGRPAAVTTPSPSPGKPHRLARTAFAQLDLRLQSEKVGFSVQVLPAGPRRAPPPLSTRSLLPRGGSSASGGSLRVMVVGVVSPLLP